MDSVILENQQVRLEPINPSHSAGLKQAITDGELWRLFVTLVPNLDGVEDFIRNAQQGFEQGKCLAFATHDAVTGKLVGSTRFMNIDLSQKRLEIGFTFLGQSAQRSGINIQAKLLMLTHAFEVLNLNRVEFVTDVLNHRSRKAIEALGAQQEGILRRNRIMPCGRVRDSVIYSVIAQEWEGVKQLLQYRLRSRG